MYFLDVTKYAKNFNKRENFKSNISKKLIV